MKILKEKRKEDSKFKKILMQFKNQLYYESNLRLKKDVRCSSVCLKFHKLYFVLDKYTVLIDGYVQEITCNSLIGYWKINRRTSNIFFQR